MARPVLRSLGTIQIDGVDFEGDGRFAPRDPEYFGLLVDARIGPADGPGATLFQFSVCSPSWMENEVAAGEYYWLRHYLLITRWDYDLVVGAVTKLCTSIEGSDWRGVTEKLSRYMRWEFEDYRPRP